ncbi:LysE family translocator [Rhodoligotrophos defluvii]|uniref:LysE family translocator n=1 Tax=Rhodoligotrophos defluvii TaxID=2561934 RepID=UPI0010C9F57D|nr:LysE family translocator [Rhodoligotrophos defluvii]
MDTDLTAWLLSVAGFAASMSGSPGPNNTMVAASGANFGFSRTIPHILGVTIGFPVMIMAVALGAGDLFRAYPLIHDLLKWIGAAYLLWLAYKIGTARPAIGTAELRDGSVRAASRPLSFLQAALFQWVNPKAWVVSLSAIATFTSADGPAITLQAFVLALIFCLVTVPSLAFWTLTGIGAARLLKTARAFRIFNLSLAALLIISLVPQVIGH